jgi:DNA polymerase epsilon subunit 1
VFMQLLAEFKRLGARVVFASFTRLVIATSKSSLTHATTYVQYAKNTIISKDLFSVIDLVPMHYYENLIFMDSANFGAILPLELSAPAAEGSAESSQGDADNASVVQRVLSNWNMAEYLPPLAKEAFVLIISDYLWAPYQHLQQRLLQKEALAAAVAVEHGEAPPVPSSQDALHRQQQQSNFDAFLVELVSRQLSQRLFEFVQAIQREHPADTRTDAAAASTVFPILPGSHLPLHHPAMEFIKYVTHVIALDANLQAPVRGVFTIRRLVCCFALICFDLL